MRCGRNPHSVGVVHAVTTKSVYMTNLDIYKKGANPPNRLCHKGYEESKTHKKTKFLWVPSSTLEGLPVPVPESALS